jgi:hypothetical protein
MIFAEWSYFVGTTTASWVLQLVTVSCTVRFVNHLCSPNLFARIESDKEQGEPRMELLQHSRNYK